MFFTGSHATGRRIAQALGGRFVKLQLELGGKDPQIVCADADLANAVSGAYEYWVKRSTGNDYDVSRDQAITQQASDAFGEIRRYSSRSSAARRCRFML